MLIIGCDFHTRYQQIAMAKEETGELLLERRLDHQSGEAHAFYRNLQAPVRVGIEATGPIHWFERLLAELGHELWIGDSGRIRACEVRKQETRSTRRRADSRSAARKTFSENLGSHAERTRFPAVARSPPQARVPAHHAEQPTPCAGYEPGTVP